VRRLRRAAPVLVFAAVAAVVVLAAGCGGGGSAEIGASELAQGRTLFQTGASEGCSFCHSLAAAESVSVIGPSLDLEMREANQRSKTDGQLAHYVLGWMNKGECLNSADASRCMPARIFTGADATAVASFVAVCGRTPDHPGCAPKPSSLPSEAVVGERLFETRGCVSCHFSTGGYSTGPPLVGVAGSSVKLADGTTVPADATYLARSIAAPNSQIVSGYQPKVMSAWVDPEHITPAQIKALVAYIETLKRA
jgi:mono/diheme cytochrome c family protein